MERPTGEDLVVLAIDWPTHGRLKFTVSRRLGGNIYRRWTQLLVQTDRRVGTDPAERRSTEPASVRPAEGANPAVRPSDERAAGDRVSRHVTANDRAATTGRRGVEPPTTAESVDDPAGRPAADPDAGAPPALDIPAFAIRSEEVDRFDYLTAAITADLEITPNPELDEDVDHGESVAVEPDSVSDFHTHAHTHAHAHTDIDAETDIGDAGPKGDDPASLGVFAERPDPQDWEVVATVDRAGRPGPGDGDRPGKQDRRHQADLLRPPRSEEPPPARRRSAVRRAISSQNVPGIDGLPRRSRALRRPVPRVPDQVDDDRDVATRRLGAPTPATSRSSSSWPGPGAEEGTATPTDQHPPLIGRRGGRTDAQPDDSLAVSTAARSPVDTETEADAEGPPANDGAEGLGERRTGRTTMIAPPPSHRWSGSEAEAEAETAGSSRIDFSARPGIAARMDAAGHPSTGSPEAGYSSSKTTTSPRSGPDGERPRAVATPAAPDSAATVAARVRTGASTRNEPAWEGELVAPILVDLPRTVPSSWVGSPASLVGALVVVSSLVLLLVLAVGSLNDGFDLGSEPAPAGPAAAVVDHQRFRPADIPADSVDPSESVGTSEPVGAAGSGPSDLVDETARLTATTGPGPAPLVARPAWPAIEGQACNSNYSGCVPDVDEVACPALTGEAITWSESVVVLGEDVYGLDTDGDGDICEPDQLAVGDG